MNSPGRFLRFWTRRFITYSGNYDFYERERNIRSANQQAAFARQQSMLAKEQRLLTALHAPPKPRRCRAASRPWIRSKNRAAQKTPDRKFEFRRRRAPVSRLP